MTLILFGVGVLVVLQLAVMAMVQYNLTGRGIEKVGKMLREQNERLSAEIRGAIQEATAAAHSAYEEANTINTKLERLGLEQSAAKIQEKKDT